jgi:hypothetical protein
VIRADSISVIDSNEKVLGNFQGMQYNIKYINLKICDLLILRVQVKALTYDIEKGLTEVKY